MESLADVWSLEKFPAGMVSIQHVFIEYTYIGHYAGDKMRQTWSLSSESSEEMFTSVIPESHSWELRRIHQNNWSYIL